MIRKKNKGFALVFVVITFATILGIFFRYAMNARAQKLQIKQIQKISDTEETIDKALSFGIAEGYIMDQMIVNLNDYDGKPYNLKNFKDYFIVKDIAGGVQKIWEADIINGTVVNTYKTNITNDVWARLVKKSSGEPSEKFPGNFIGGELSLEQKKFDTNTRISKGGFYLKSVKIEGKSSETCKVDNEYTYLFYAKYGDIQPVSDSDDGQKICYIGESEPKIVNQSSEISNIDYIKPHLKDTQKTFKLELRKDAFYKTQLTGSKKIVAVFEIIAKMDIKFKEETNIVTGLKEWVIDTIPDDKFSYEVNYLGP